MRRRPPRGFTLTELMIALAVAILLAALAWPSYQHQLAKGRRADGRQALLALARQLERFHTERGTYAGATLGPGGLVPAVSSEGHYSLHIETQSVDAFTVRATPRGRHAGDACGSLLYNQLGEQMVSGEATVRAATCWQ